MSPAAPATYPQAAIDKMIAAIQFNDQGLVAAIAQQHGTGEVLMMAWMDRDAVEETMRTGRVCYWSRSRRAPWRKGETSGQVQRVVSLSVDCDQDALLLEVEPGGDGKACHTGRKSCFYRKLARGGGSSLIFVQ